MKKLLTVFICACLVLGCLAGCASETVSSYTDATADPAAESTAEAVAAHDYAAAFNAYKADTVVLTIDGSDVTWDEFFYWNYYVLNYIESYVGTVSMDDTCLFDSSSTYGEYVLDTALSYLKQYHALEVELTNAGIALTEESQTALDDQLKSDIVTYCGDEGTEADFNDYLLSLYVTPKVYNYVNTVAALYSDGFDTLYGADGGKLTDAEVLAWAEEQGYMRAKHILISTTDDEGAALDDEAKAEKLAEAEKLYAQLSTITDEVKLEEKFDELMNDNSEDTGLASYPDGYYFAPGDMVEVFETAVTELGDYGLSEIVESDYGYHIILRLPLETDGVVQYDSSGNSYALRYIAASDLYNTKVDEWVANAEVVWAADFEGFALTDALFTAKEGYSVSDIVIGVVLTLVVYALPIVIYRYAVLKKPAEKKKARKITIIYGVCFLAAIGLVIYFLSGTGAAAGAVVLWSFANYFILTAGKKDAPEPSAPDTP